MKVKLHYIGLVASIIFIGSCISKKETTKSNSNTKEENEPSSKIPGFNPGAVSVNSIAPDRGLADPHVLIVNDTLYVMCGHDRDWNSLDCCPMDRWELWSTVNLTDWEHILNILPTQTYIGDQDHCWAGDLATRDGKYYWYFSNRNINTGVMVAPSMHGPWTDALGKPLIPKGLIPTKSYDPEIYTENGVYYIIFGAGQYYIAELGEDMISLATVPELIKIFKEDGSIQYTADQPQFFKRGDWYYLIWGNQYSMSRNLKGPYTYKGEYLHGGHGSVFQWKEQWYAIQENHETNALFRGVQLRPLYFNEDSTVYIPRVNWEYPLPGRAYTFENSTQGWKNENGTAVKRNANEAYIFGKTKTKGEIITSLTLLHTPIHLCENVKIVLKNIPGVDSIKLALNRYGDGARWQKQVPRVVDWSKEEWVSAAVQPTGEWQEIIIPLSKFKAKRTYLHQIALQPASNKVNAEWLISSVVIE